MSGRSAGARTLIVPRGRIPKGPITTTFMSDSTTAGAVDDLGPGTQGSCQSRS